jgi:myo-inositol-1(or 4)-monophosphatase
MSLEQLTTNVIAIAKEAGAFLSEQRNSFRPEEVIEKRSHDYVSYVDKETEILIIKRLSELLPEAGFITEEGQGEYRHEDYCWIIDPLDGTTNYIHDYAPYCVSIALRKGGEFLIGVVYEVCRDECFWAWKDGGAYLNGKKISSSHTTEIEKSFVGIGLPYSYQKYQSVVDKLIPQLYSGTIGLRISGSAAANLCYVAAGRYDLWFEAYIKLWDFAAGALIVKEAGGVVSGFDGNPDFAASHHVLASATPDLHRNALNLLSGFAGKM